MRHVQFHPSTLTGDDRAWWDAWAKRAEEARLTVLKDFKEKAQQAALANPGVQQAVDFNSKVWSDLKTFLLEKVFHGKCAYCDSRIDDTSFGDAEHYRPKGKVTSKVNGQALAVQVGTQDHPGYYWLAYDWCNLLPACSQCNSGHGKMNQFPIAGTYASRPEDAADLKTLDQQEQPLLLHPYKHYPRKYLQFGEKGVVTARAGDPLGQASIDTYNLNRGALAEIRWHFQDAAWKDFCDAMKTQTQRAVLERLKAGKEPHATAALDYVLWQYERSKPEILDS